MTAPAPPPDPDAALTIQVTRHRGDGVAWTIDLDRGRLRRATLLVVFTAVLLVVGVGSWVVLAVHGYRTAGLPEEVEMLRAERDRVTELAATLAEVETVYGRIAELFGLEGLPVEAVWLPPPAGGVGGASGAPRAGADPDTEAPPSTWPLTERGFLTQRLLTEDPDRPGEGHPGVDIAIPSGSYIRAMGPGRVVERGEDEVYGLYLILEHGGGYRSLYAHASVVVVEEGREVRAGEVLGLTGSSGRSSAPHLHIEITLDGEHVDPLTLLRRP